MDKMVLSDISVSENRIGEKTVIIKSKGAENKVKEHPYVNSSFVGDIDTNVQDRRENHVYEHLQRADDSTTSCKRGCVARFKQYKDCIMLSLIGGLFVVAVTALAISIIGLPEKAVVTTQSTTTTTTPSTTTSTTPSATTSMTPPSTTSATPSTTTSTTPSTTMHSTTTFTTQSTTMTTSTTQSTAPITIPLTKSTTPSTTTSVGRNCKDMMDKGETTTGFKTIVPDGIYPIKVLCVMGVDGGGWTVFHKRESATDFYKNWTEYRNGFGDDTNFWLGLENIHHLTAKGNYELRVDMTRTNNQHAAAKYQTFSVGNETMLYKLSIGNYSFDPAFNDPGDSFSRHNGMKFTTYDKDNDADSSNCAVLYKGGYWYNNCDENNLNGLYGSTNFSQGINWYTWTGYYESLMHTRMMIRPN